MEGSFDDPADTAVISLEAQIRVLLIEGGVGHENNFIKSFIGSMRIINNLLSLESEGPY